MPTRSTVADVLDKTKPLLDILNELASYCFAAGQICERGAVRGIVADMRQALADQEAAVTRAARSLVEKMEAGMKAGLGP